MAWDKCYLNQSYSSYESSYYTVNPLYRDFGAIEAFNSTE